MRSLLLALVGCGGAAGTGSDSDPETAGGTGGCTVQAAFVDCVAVTESSYAGGPWVASTRETYDVCGRRALSESLGTDGESIYTQATEWHGDNYARITFDGGASRPDGVPEEEWLFFDDPLGRTDRVEIDMAPLGSVDCDWDWEYADDSDRYTRVENDCGPGAPRTYTETYAWLPEGAPWPYEEWRTDRQSDGVEDNVDTATWAPGSSTVLRVVDDLQSGVVETRTTEYDGSLLLSVEADTHDDGVVDYTYTYTYDDSDRQTGYVFDFYAQGTTIAYRTTWTCPGTAAARARPPGPADLAVASLLAR